MVHTTGKFDARGKASFEGPNATNVAHGVTSTPEQQERFVERFYKFNTVGVACTCLSISSCEAID